VVKYICFCMMTPEFLQLPLEEREGYIPKWETIAKKQGFKLLFWGNVLGVPENAVFVFEAPVQTEKYFKLLREWLELGTSDAGKLISYTRTVTVN
jgi:hypothetical protein